MYKFEKHQMESFSRIILYVIIFLTIIIQSYKLLFYCNILFILIIIILI